MGFRKIYLVACIFLFLSLSVFALDVTISGKENNFLKISTKDFNGYTTDNFLKSDSFMATDKLFYGSKEGQIKIIVYLNNKVPVNSKIGIQAKSKNIKLIDVNINNVQTKITSPIAAKSTIVPTTFILNSGITKVALLIDFNAADIIAEKLDIILYDSLNHEIARLDPFISGYNFRIPFWIQGATTDVQHVHYFDVNADKLGASNASFWANIQADGDDIRFTAANGTTIYDYNLSSFSLNSYARFNILFPTWNTGDNNGYMYYGNPSATSASIPINLQQYDTFEDGDLTAKPVWTVASGSPAVQSITAIKGTYSGVFYDNATIRTAITLTPPNNDYYAWLRVTGTNGNKVIMLNDSSNVEMMDWGVRVGKIRYNNGTTWTDTGITADVNTNYLFRINYVNSAVTVDFYVYAENGTLITSALGVVETQPAVVNKMALYEDQDPGLNQYMFFDNVTFGTYAQNAWFFGTLETGNQPPDFNLTAFYSYAQYKGGTAISVPFKIQDLDNNTLYIDLNYSTSTTQGTGIAIINDINSQTLNCDQINLALGANCSYSWTLPVIDGNFYINGSAYDGSATDFNHSNFNFLIDSNAPTLYNQQPAATYDKNVMLFDFNVSITDGNGSGTLRCIRRLYINTVANSDANIDVNAGSCYSSITGLSISCGDKIKVGWYGVDNVENISAELQTADINYSCLLPSTPPPAAPTKSKPTRYYNRTQNQDMTDIEKETSGFQNTIVLYGSIALILLAAIGVYIWKKR